MVSAYMGSSNHFTGNGLDVPSIQIGAEIGEGRTVTAGASDTEGLPTIYSLAQELDNDLDDAELHNFIATQLFGSPDGGGEYTDQIGQFVQMLKSFEWEGETLDADGVITNDELVYSMHVAANATFSPTGTDANGNPVIRSNFHNTAAETDPELDGGYSLEPGSGLLTLEEAQQLGYSNHSGNNAYVGAHNVIGFVDVFGNGGQDYSGQGLGGQAAVVTDNTDGLPALGTGAVGTETGEAGTQTGTVVPEAGIEENGDDQEEEEVAA